jgi:hypothetical protein
MAEIDKKKLEEMEETEDEKDEVEDENEEAEEAEEKELAEETTSADVAAVEGTENNLVDESKLPFPRATITKLVRKSIKPGKQLKGTVKDEMNMWVASMIERLGRKMNSNPYTYVNYEMLKEAISPYENLQDINTQREELLTRMSSIKNQCNEVIEKIDADSKKKINIVTADEEHLPFPRATITRKLRKVLEGGKTIRGPVKKGLNSWLGSLVERVSKRMDVYEYQYIDRSMFKEAVEPYEAVAEIELEKERIIQQMESIKTACDILKMEIERKFRM